MTHNEESLLAKNIKEGTEFLVRSVFREPACLHWITHELTRLVSEDLVDFYAGTITSEPLETFKSRQGHRGENQAHVRKFREALPLLECNIEELRASWESEKVSGRSIESASARDRVLDSCEEICRSLHIHYHLLSDAAGAVENCLAFLSKTSSDEASRDLDSRVLGPIDEFAKRGNEISRHRKLWIDSTGDELASPLA